MNDAQFFEYSIPSNVPPDTEIFISYVRVYASADLFTYSSYSEYMPEKDPPSMVTVICEASYVFIARAAPKTPEPLVFLFA